MATNAHVDADIATLVSHIQRLGKDDGSGTYTITFGQLFKDDQVQNTLEVCGCTTLHSSTLFHLTRLHVIVCLAVACRHIKSGEEAWCGQLQA